MLIYDPRVRGNRIYKYRKKAGLTQSELAEKAGLADRTFADIERGSSNMRVETLLKICDALRISPNDILYELSDEEKEGQETIYTLLETQEKEDQLQLTRILKEILALQKKR